MSAGLHPDFETLRAFREHRLSGSGVTTVALHLAECSSCARISDADVDAALRALTARIPEDHLSDEQLDVLADQRAGDAAYGAAARHAGECAVCRAEVDDLRAFVADEPLPETPGPALPIVPAWSRRRTRGGMVRWIAAAAALLIVATVAVLNRRSPAPQRVPLQQIAKAATPQTAAPVVLPRVVATLHDASGDIVLRDDGTLAGVHGATRLLEETRAVLGGGSLSIPTFISAMPGAVRGDARATAPAIRAVEPFRSAVRDRRPRFVWSPVPNARSYRVAIYDAGYDEIASSEPLTRTSWQPEKPLPAGVDLTWHVVADTPAGEISSAGSDRPEAVFRVLSREDAEELAQAEASGGESHLARGLLYSRYGLMHDAANEFRALAKLNPGSPIAAKLVETVAVRD